MISRQPNATRTRWALTLPTTFATMLIAFSVMNARFMPLGYYGTSTQESRKMMMAPWEYDEARLAPSYAKADPNHRKTKVVSLRESKIMRSDSPQSMSSSFLKTTSGKGWKMWDRKSILFDDMDLTCNWNDYKPFIPRGSKAHKPVPFCAHPLSDDQFVSNSIVKKGRHLECDALPKFLSQSLERSSSTRNNKNEDEDRPVIYVDVGANIGTCVMQMLLTTNATILAFEPHPYNLFVMTSTFMKLDPKYRDRINLFPIALGAESSDSTIHMASDNRGHAVVSKVIRINRKATFLPPIPIRVEPLDSILRVQDDHGKNNDDVGVDIHLMKIDAQGYECYIYDGMKSVLAKTMTVFFELERQVLNGFDGCSPQLLFDRFLSSGFQMHAGGPGRPPIKEAPDKGKTNIVALKS